MNNYLVAVWKIGDNFTEKALLSYASTKELITGKHYLKNITLLTPNELESVVINGSQWRWKNDMNMHWIPFILEHHICSFEAADDNAARLIYEVGGYV